MLNRAVRAEPVEALFFFSFGVTEEKAALRQAQGERLMVAP
jgi:hypothetical protein